MRVTILNRSDVAVPRAFLSRFLSRAESELRSRLSSKRHRGLLNLELLIVFVGQSEAKRLNQQFRQRAYATDVLSFAPVEPESIGELVMSPEVLKKQAQEIGFSFRDETAYMCLHGLLHLLGFDHEQSAAQAKKMFKLQDEVFEKILKV